MHASVRPCLAALALVLLAAITLAAPVGAIVYGEPDGHAHPNVGALVVEAPDGARFALCSGTLIAPATYLTAAHCVAALEEFDLALIGVSFDSVFDPSSSAIVPAAEAIANPAYDGTPYTDVAVVLLVTDASDYYPDIEPAALPTVGLLETLRPSAQRGQPSRGLTIVGYGLSAYERGGGPPQPVYTDVRMRGETRLIGLGTRVTGDALVQTTAARGTGGGTCYGDSGGPFFVQGTDTVVAITVTGFNRHCGGADLSLRIDTAAVLAFLAPYV